MLLTAACAKNATDQTLERTTVRWGTSFGMCGGYCRTELQIDGATLRLTRMSWDTARYPTVMQQQPLTETTRQQIAEKLDRDAISRLKDVYGCPDCADGGAEWVEVETAQFKKRVTFEYNKSPAELQALVTELRALRGRFAAE
jgi:hypothetical protein